MNAGLFMVAVTTILHEMLKVHIYLLLVPHWAELGNHCQTHKLQNNLDFSTKENFKKNMVIWCCFGDETNSIACKLHSLTHSIFQKEICISWISNHRQPIFFCLNSLARWWTFWMLKFVCPIFLNFNQGFVRNNPLLWGQKLYQFYDDNFDALTLPLDLVFPGARGLVGSCLATSSFSDFSTFPCQGLLVRWGDTRIHSSRKGLYLVCGCSSASNFCKLLILLIY